MDEKLNLEEEGVYKLFNATSWCLMLDEHQSAYRSLNYLLEDPEALRSHLTNVTKDMEDRAKEDEVLRFIFELGEVKQCDEPNVLVSFGMVHLAQAFLTYSKQALVVISSFYDGIVCEFLECVFCRYPMRMYDFLTHSPENSSRGKLDLREVVVSPNLRELVYQLANRASIQASKGKFESVVKNLVRVTRKKVNPDLLNELAEYINIRNKIVHEFYEVTIEPSKVEAAFEILNRIIQHLEDVATSEDIPFVSINPEDEE